MSHFHDAKLTKQKVKVQVWVPLPSTSYRTDYTNCELKHFTIFSLFPPCLGVGQGVGENLAGMTGQTGISSRY